MISRDYQIFMICFIQNVESCYASCWAYRRFQEQFFPLYIPRATPSSGVQTRKKPWKIKSILISEDPHSSPKNYFKQYAVKLERYFRVFVDGFCSSGFAGMWEVCCLVFWGYRVLFASYLHTRGFLCGINLFTPFPCSRDASIIVRDGMVNVSHRPVF